jgi:hypothetical protein
MKKTQFIVHRFYDNLCLKHRERKIAHFCFLYGRISEWTVEHVSTVHTWTVEACCTVPAGLDLVQSLKCIEPGLTQ